MTVTRRQSEADIYHVISRGTGRQIIFEEGADWETYLRILAHALVDADAELYAYCLMSNHVHLLIHAPIDDVSRIMKVTNGTYARYFNDKSGRTGHLFQERFISEPINDDRYLMTAICYIHDNPRKARISNVEDYPWSSYGEYTMGKGTMCSTSLPLEVFGGREAFISIQRAFNGSTQCADIDQPRNRTRPMRDDVARSAADEVLGGRSLNELKLLPVNKRDDYLRLLGECGLSIRQIERLTGIGRGSIERAWKYGKSPVDLP